MKLLNVTLLLILCSLSPSNASNLLRLYDFAPVSAANPIIAAVPECGIAIPMSELRGYVNALPGATHPQLTLDRKRALLQKLLDEHFLMWAGYREKADHTPEIIHRLDVTKAMLMRETLVSQEVGAKAKTRDEYHRLYQSLCDRLFERTDIMVSNPTYEQLKSTIAAATSPATLAPAVRDLPFATCKSASITVGDVLDFYMQMPVESRPNFRTRSGVEKILEQMLTGSLLTEEAQSRGLDAAPLVVEKLQLNRNMMVRMYALDQIAAEAVARAHRPDADAQTKQWYVDHLKDRYTYTDAKGATLVVPLDAQHGRIEDDYIDNLREVVRAEHLQRLRRQHEIEINEQVLAQAPL